MTSKQALGISTKKRKKPKAEIKVPPRLYLDSDSPQIEKKAIPNKGTGVVARTDLPENTRIGYKGVAITMKQYKDLVKLQRTGGDYKDYTNYIASANGATVDAHPRHGDWINAYVNEPSEGKEANMRLTSEMFHGKRRPVFIAVRPIAKDEELTVKYGGSFKRVGYTPGTIATKPKWWKDRTKRGAT